VKDEGQTVTSFQGLLASSVVRLQVEDEVLTCFVDGDGIRAEREGWILSPRQ
jgi:hypothetical protein